MSSLYFTNKDNNFNAPKLKDNLTCFD